LLQKYIKNVVFELLERLFRSDRGRRTLLDAVASRKVLDTRSLGLELADQPYADLPTPASTSSASTRSDIVFITARFRSGSTLLWNLFRQVPGVTAYYEPFNERKWFDPATRGNRIDSTHRQVESYWREYDGLGELAKWYEEDWIRRNLYMGENAWAPRMKRYVELLIERSPGRPVLQFNRIDFRLPWFRRNFPNAQIVHLYRHPRDQWCSSLLGSTSCGVGDTFATFKDHFYLLTWARDLSDRFPFLREDGIGHPYELYYFIWRLSYMFGRRCADHSVCFERLLSDPHNVLQDMFDTLGIEGTDPKDLESLIVCQEGGKWRQYANDHWFRAIEEACERVLADFFVTDTAKARGASTIGLSEGVV
jgi:hypothetical protein